MSITSLVAKMPLQRPASGPDVRAVQLALRAAGHELVTDGDFGAVTEAAVKDFQHSHGLETDGEVGPRTAAALDAVFAGATTDPHTLLHSAPLPSTFAVAPWLSVMRAITGTKEVQGAGDSPIILGWVKAIVALYPDLKGNVGWYTHDSVPWCGLAVAYCVAKAGFKPPVAPLGAANWFNDWKDGYKLTEPCPGAILVKTRKGGAHVTMYEREDSNFYFCRGGNQSDMVNVSAIRKDATVRGFMWPNGGPAPGHRLLGTIASARAGSEA